MNKTNGIIASVFAFVQASYASEEREKFQVIKVEHGNLVLSGKNKDKAAKIPGKRGRPKKVENLLPIEQPLQTSQEKQTVVTFSLPKAGSINAEQFYKALRTAGKRFVEGQGVITDPIAQRIDERAAIAGFVGYDMSEAHGTQLDSARRAARRAEQPVTPKEYKRGVPGIEGINVVAGVPDPIAKRLDNFKAREALCASEMVDFVREAQTLPKGASGQEYAAGRAALEKARLNHIQADLRAS